MCENLLFISVFMKISAFFQAKQVHILCEYDKLPQRRKTHESITTSKARLGHI
jgi:hypothetical protein